MEFSISVMCFDTVKSRCSQFKVLPKTMVFISLMIMLVLANCADPGEMPHLGLHCLRYPLGVSGLQSVKG